MIVYRDVSEIAPAEPSAATIGTFDGVHLGHLQIIERVTSIAGSAKLLSTVVTFDPHPRKIVAPAPANSFGLLTTTEEKVEVFRNLGIDQLAIIPFTLEFSRLSSEQFVREILLARLKAREVVIGYDHHFGRDREGGIEKLQRMAREERFGVHRVPPYDIGGEVISSSLLRRLVMSGEVDRVNELSGRPYRLSGTVVRGDGRGKGIGFPTANIDITSQEKILPAQGVYAVEVRVDGARHKGMMNIGVRPTFDIDRLTLEVHIFNFDAVLYGKPIDVFFKKFVRKEQKFSGIKELREQLEEDKRICSAI